MSIADVRRAAESDSLTPRREGYTSLAMRTRVQWILSVAAILTIAPGIFARSRVATDSAPRLVTVNQGSKNISIIDPAKNRVVATISEKQSAMHGHEAAASPDGRTAYVPIYGNVGVGKPGLNGHEMLVIDLPARRIAGHVDFGHGVRPHCVVYNPADGLLYVTTELDDTVSIVNPRTLKIVGTIPTGQAESHMLALSPDGKRGYTANVGPGTVSVLSIPERKTIAVIPVAAKVQRISVSRDGKMVFTSDQITPRLAVIDTATNKVAHWVPLPGLGYGTASTKDGRFLLVAIPAKSQVAVVDLKSLKVVRTIPVPSAPQEILVRPDGKIAYVSCNRQNKVAAIDLEHWKVAAVIDAGAGVDGLAWAQ